MTTYTNLPSPSFVVPGPFLCCGHDGFLLELFPNKDGNGKKCSMRVLLGLPSSSEVYDGLSGIGGYEVLCVKFIINIGCPPKDPWRTQLTKTAMASTAISINDLTTEIIELFAPDRRPKTISTLRLVSKRFRDVFTADHYYRSYLCYPDKLNLYSQDLEEIGDAAGRWRRVLEAEKRRLNNWRNGRTIRVDVVEFPQMVAGSLKGLIDKEGEYWMTCKCKDTKIALLNFTKEPIFKTYDITSYQIPLDWNAEIAPGQIVINERNASHVFNYFKNSDSVSLEYKFKIKGMEPERVIISGKTNMVSGQRNLLINYKRTGDAEGLMRVWDITNKNELESIALRDFGPFKPFFDKNFYSLHLFTGTFPNVLIIVSDHAGRISKSSAAIFNVETRQMTNFFGWIENLDFHNSFFTDSFAGLVIYNEREGFILKVYAVRQTFDVIRQQPIVCTLSYNRSRLSACSVDSIILTDFPTYDDATKEMYIYALSIDGSNIIENKYLLPHNVLQGYEYLLLHEMIGPFFIFHSVIPHFCKTYDEHGNELFDWNTKLQEYSLGHRRNADEAMAANVNGEQHDVWRLEHYDNAFWPRDIAHLQNLFKCTLQNDDGNLVIFNF